MCLRASSGFPAPSELKANAEACYPIPQGTKFNADAPILPVVIGVDELKVTERLCWHAQTDNILGVCREHGDICSLKFRSITEADNLLGYITQKRVHLASEVCSSGIFYICILINGVGDNYWSKYPIRRPIRLYCPPICYIWHLQVRNCR